MKTHKRHSVPAIVSSWHKQTSKMIPSSIFQPRFRIKILHGFTLFAILLVFWFHLYPKPTFTLINENNQHKQPQQQQQQQPQPQHQHQQQQKKKINLDDGWRFSSIPYFDSIMETVDLHFPGATPSWTTLQAVKRVIEKRGYTPANTLFAQSICPDEINHEPGNSIPNLFAEYLGEVFHLGGLGAIPFTGKTGFAAYSSHVPDGGHLFILLAPHIGISDNGRQLGQHSRPGQAATTYSTGPSLLSSSSSSSPLSPQSSQCCGAAIGAMGHLPDMEATNHMDESDQQMAYLTQHINQHRREILDTSTSENVILANLARVNHDIALDYLHNIVNVNFGNTNSTLVILTGIQINMPRPALQEFFKALSFTIQYNNGTIMDLFDETFNKPQQEETKKRPTQKK